jgi:cell shape-determining protein MreC|tara:strand:- start:36 stop:209 length:174 start_codon:yes stop_codon:yes gene_type:complete
MYNYEHAHELARQEIRRLHAVINEYKQEFKQELNKLKKENKRLKNQLNKKIHTEERD